MSSSALREEMCPEQLFSTEAFPSAARVQDHWGRTHAITDGLQVGRTRGDSPRLLLLHPTVSKVHAHFAQEMGGWTLYDLASRNGTYVDGQRVESTRIRHGQRLAFGDIELEFQTNHVESIDLSWSTVDARVNFPDLVRFYAQGDSGGRLLLKDAEVRLSRLLSALLMALHREAEKNSALPPRLRGFSSTRELLLVLPWNSPFPTENHLKQATRRLRDAFAKLGISDAVGAEHGLGYRLSPNLVARLVVSAG